MPTAPSLQPAHCAQRVLHTRTPPPPSSSSFFHQLECGLSLRHRRKTSSGNKDNSTSFRSSLKSLNNEEAAAICSPSARRGAARSRCLSSSKKNLIVAAGSSSSSTFVDTAITDYHTFKKASQKGNAVPLVKRIFSDHLTPVIAYRCLVGEDDREAPRWVFPQSIQVA